MTQILIIRHGNTFDPDETPTRVGARTDLPLTQSGIEQARALGVYLKSHDLLPDYICASALSRQQQTAQIMMKDAHKAMEIHTDPRFTEIDHGPDENKTEEEISERIGKKALEDWDDYNVVPDGWDVCPRTLQTTWLDFANECLMDRENKVSCVVSSGGIIRFAPVILEGNHLPDNQSPKVKTASMSLFKHDGQMWYCKFWNKRPE